MGIDGGPDLIGHGQADPESGRLLLVNQRLCAITGYPAEELLRLTVPQITHPDDRAADQVSWQRSDVPEVQTFANDLVRKAPSILAGLHLPPGPKS